MTQLLVAATLSLFLGFVARHLLHRAGVIDRPNERSSHAVPTVRGGGIGFVGVLVGALLLGSREEPAFAWLAVATVALAVVGFVDDLRSVGVRTRLAVHVAAACVPAIAFITDAAPATLGLAVVALVGTVVLTNASNFMDGIDGIATAHAVVGFLATAALATRALLPDEVVRTYLALAGAVLGFLPWNFPRARMFMGDVASAPLGFLLAAGMVLVVRDGGLRLVLAFTVVHLGFLLDTGITVLRRLARGARITEAHREHFYQRGVRSGLGHPVVTVAYTVLTGIGGTVAYVLPTMTTSLATLTTAAMLVGWLALFAVFERRFRRTEIATGGAR